MGQPLISQGNDVASAGCCMCCNPLPRFSATEGARHRLQHVSAQQVTQRVSHFGYYLLWEAGEDGRQCSCGRGLVRARRFGGTGVHSDPNARLGQSLCCYLPVLGTNSSSVQGSGGV